jgi:hypothetical protein
LNIFLGSSIGHVFKKQQIISTEVVFKIMISKHIFESSEFERMKVKMNFK